MIERIGHWLTFNLDLPEAQHEDFDDRVEAIIARVDVLEERVSKLEGEDGLPGSTPGRPPGNRWP